MAEARDPDHVHSRDPGHHHHKHKRPRYKLTYYNAKAFGEPIRYFLSYLKKDFEDVRLPPTPALEPSVSGAYFPRVPNLEIDGDEVIDHPVAIMRYLANEAGISGDNIKEYLEIDILIGYFCEMQSEIMRYVKATNEEEKKKMKEKLLRNDIPSYMDRFKDNVDRNRGYMANGKITWVDMYVVAFCESFPWLLGINAFEKYPFLNELKDKVQSLPGIKEYILRRPVTEI